jgi:hypothetical protein
VVRTLVPLSAVLIVAGCQSMTSRSSRPSAPITSSAASVPADSVPMEPTYRPPLSATLAVRHGSVSRTGGIAILFHPNGGAVSVFIAGAGRYLLCPSDATGLPVAGDASSSWGPAWSSTRCRRLAGGDAVRLPDPPDAHVGILVLAAGSAQVVTEVEVHYRPTDAFAAYRLGEVTSQPTLLRGWPGVGPVTATVYDECTAGVTYQIDDGPQQPTCRSTVTGALGSINHSVILRPTGSPTGPTPLIVVIWPPPTR